MKNLSGLLVFLLSSSLLAASGGLEIGGDANSGYENLSCKQMITENLSFQAHSSLNENTLKEMKDRCLKIGSKQLGGLLTFGKAEREQCFKELEVKEKQFESKVNEFVNALGIRVQIMDSLSIGDKSKLSPECLHVTAKSYQRAAAMTDFDFFKKLYLKCKIKTEVSMGPATLLKNLYSSPASYRDREVCQSYIYEYTKLRDGHMFSRAERPAAKVEAEAAAPALRCMTYKCSELLASPTNNPSPCYRNAVIDCMASGKESANGGTPAGVSTGK